MWDVDDELRLMVIEARAQGVVVDRCELRMESRMFVPPGDEVFPWVATINDEVVRGRTMGEAAAGVVAAIVTRRRPAAQR